MDDSTQKRKVVLSFLRCEVVAILVCVISALGNAQAYNIGNGAINACAGTFYDSNGAANYFNGENFTYTICSGAAGQCVRLTFTSFSTEANFDFLSIYNGPSTASPLIGTYTGAVSPGTVTGTSGCLTFVFTSDLTVRGAGWTATISCIACGAGGGPCAQNCAGAPPANDACSGAQNLGTLSVPQACPNGTAAWATFNTTNLCATAEVPYTSVIGCQPAGNMANPAADVWYQFTITAPTLNVQITGLQTPECAIYQGTTCGNMIPMGCAIGGAGNLTTTFGGLASGTYFMQVSGGSVTDRCAFTLQLQNNYDCQGCVIQSSLTVNPPPFNGTYQPGQTVNFCYTITDYNQTSINWLHAVCPSFGPGWNPATLVTANPANCSGQGAWNYYNALVTSSATGLVTGPGWFYESALGSPLGLMDGNPGDNFGDNNPLNTCDWTFCWNITTTTNCVNGTSCNISIDTYGDGESGSWTSFACNLDPITHFFATLACCTPPTVNVTNINCATGTASATASGTSNGPWTYVWHNAAGATIQQANNINGTNTINNLPAGTYTVIIVDNANCASQQTFTVTAPNSMTVTPNQTNILCNGGATGSAHVTIAGGSGPYTYSWAPSGGTAATANNLTAGTYTVTIHDNAGCVTTQQFTITQPTVLTAAASGTNVNCNGGNNGTASVNAGGGTAPFTYSWSPSGGTAANASNLTAGTYTVTVTDANGCIKTASYTVTQPTILTATMGVPTNVNCNGGNNGSATVTAGGGVGPYTYAWAPSGGATATGTNLTAGGYTVTVTDANGCSVNSNVNIIQPPAVTANINASTNVLCNGGNTGSASVTAGGGTPGYTYAWAPSGGAGSAANNLTAGNYTVTITDAHGCIQNAVVNITQPPVLTASTTHVNVLCNGATTGSANVTPAGGTAGYTYSWAPSGGTGAIEPNLGAGTYTATITDANGCTTTASATITQPTAITSTTASTPTNCGASTGTASVTPAGGAGGYTYSWAPSGGNASNATNLVAGAYVVTITDANGCQATANVAVSNNAGPTATIPASTNVNCNGGANGTANSNAAGGTGPYTYAWTPSGGNAANATGLSAGTYTVTITDANGCSASTNINITEPPIVTAAITNTTDVNCNGGTTGNATVVAGGGTPGYTYSWAPSGGAGTTANNLGAGSYTVTVTDAHGCIETATATIVQPPALTATVPPVTNVLCNGGSTGSASVNAGGGTAPYTYLWAPSGGNGATASGLAAGNYSVTVTDANGCTSVANAVITQPAVLTSVISASANISCNGANNGTATVTAGGGTAAYTYVWTPSGGTGATESNLSGGNYSVTVTDANGCVSNAAVVITEPTILQTSTSGTNVDCNGNANGSATVSPTGGTVGYTYSWTPSGGAGATASNLSGGTYYITVTDANGCTASDSFVVVEPAVLASNISSSTDALCNGSADGTASVLSNGGTPALTYNWTPIGGTGATASNLPAGVYSVTTTDANGCTTIVNVTIAEPTALALPTTPTDVLCNGGTSGSATVNAGGGTSPYTYLWTSGGTNATENNLAAGNYSVTVTDANGCVDVANVTITEPVVLTTSTTPVDALCNGGATGSATVTPAGGTAPFTYSWTSGGTAATENNLAAGNYSVTVTDANGCTSVANVTIAEPTTLTSSTTPTNALCNGGATGSATVIAGGGTNPYTYSWTSGGTGATENNLAAGNYSVTVTDGNGCTSIANVTIAEPTTLTSSTTPTAVLCNGGTTGSATVTAGGGTNPYTYSWTSGGTAATENNLAAGNYSVTTTDGNGCTSVANVVITEPTLLTSSTTPTAVLCNGGTTGSATVTAGGGTNPYTYSWTSGGTAATENNLAAGNYSVTTTDGNGCTSIANVVITEPTLLTSSTTPIAVLCNGGTTGSATVTAGGGTNPYTYSWTSGGTAATENNLAAGNYSVTTTDGNGCTSVANVVITEPTLLTSSTTPTDALCNGGATGSATVTAGGGTNPYTYSWTSGGTAATENNLAAGNYSVTVTDGNGCTAIANVTIAQPSMLTSSTTPTAVLCNGGTTGSATVTAGGGTNPYTYSWTSGGTAATENNLAAGNYSVTTTDGNGCTSIANVVITEPTLLTSSTTPTAVLCNGGTTGSATVVAGGGTNPYTYSWTSGGTAATENNLVAGNYSVTTTDGNGCISIANVVITEPTLLTSSTTPTAVLCNGGTTGSATVTAGGGTNPYTYSWTSGGTAATENNLSAGNYSVTTTDGNGCTSIANVVITEPTLLSSSTTPTNVLCNGGTTGSASVIAGGGTNPYTYSWTSGGTAATENNLAAGNYSVTTTDGNGCTSIANVVITEPTLLTSSATPIAVLCNGGTTGSASVIAGGGTNPYTYSWTSGGTGTVENNLAAGNYSVTTTDGNGCTSVANVVITEPTLMTNINTSGNVLCNGGNTGWATVTVAGGAGAYTYTWTPGGVGGATDANIAAGNYSVVVADANGCIVNAAFTIAEPAVLTASMSATDVFCNGGNNGTASVTVNGGTSGYTYLWAPGGDVTPSVSNRPAGNYSATITDANGCTTTASATISEPVVLTSGVSALVDVLCNGGNNGSASVTVNGGTTPYTYAWTPVGGAAVTANNLTAGNYTVNITDANGCTTATPVTIAEPTLLTSSANGTNVNCNGGNNGTASVTVNGGTAGYTYSWTPAGGTGAAATNLSAGNYTVNIIDANGCTSSASYVVTQPTVVTSSTVNTNVACNAGADGTATVTVGGGVAPYTYSWFPVGGATATASNLSAGNYTVTITDGNGCVSTASATVTEPTALTSSANTVNSTCGNANGTASVVAGGGTAGYTYVWAPSGGNAATANNLAAGAYTVTVTDANGCTSVANAPVANTAGQTATANVQQDVLCNGGNTGIGTVNVVGGTAPVTYSWSPAGGAAATANNLTAGNYTVTTTDANGCISIDNITIAEPAVLAASASATPALCNGSTDGNASSTVNGGTTPYTYSWTGGGGTGSTATNLSAGNYTVTITDGNGCVTTATTTVTQPVTLTANATPVAVLCNGGSNGSASVVANGGTAGYTYSWFPSGGTTATENNLTSGTYTVTITDANGCVQTASATVTQPAAMTTNTNSTPATCGSSNGTASVVVGGGAGGYTYSWSPAGGAGATASNVAAGAYTVTITDANGCQVTDVANVSNTGGPAVTASVQQNVLCNGGNTGRGTVNAVGGTAPYTYAWSPIGGTAATSSNIPAGNYTVTVTDANGCISSDNITITEPTALAAQATPTDALCNGGNSGSATSVVAGGTAPYTYSWTGGGGTAATANNLSAGNYTVTITDGNGCTTTALATVGQPAAIALNASATPALCNGGASGTTTVVVNGGTAGYTYSWFPAGGSAATATNLSSGSYTVTVTDANGCTQTASANVTDPAAMTANTNSTAASCGGSNGTASVVVGNGTAPYTYSWTSGGTAATENNLTAGAYTVTITDANGCTATAIANVANSGGATITASVQQNVLCNSGTNGSATVNVVGGVGPFTYAWSPAGGTGVTATNLGAGNYTITVTGSNGCISTDNVTITEPAALSALASSTNVACNGVPTGTASVLVAGGTTPYTYSWTGGGGTSANASNLGAGNYTVTITDGNGCVTASSTAITQPPAITLSATSTNVLCNGASTGSATATAGGGSGAFTYSWSPVGGNTTTASNLAAGNYTVTVTDQNGCTSNTIVTVTQPTAMAVNTNTISATCGASNGSATVVVGGGATPYTYLWSPVGGTGATANNISAGAYTVTITDANGCTSNGAAAVSNAGGPSINASVGTNVNCNGGSNGSASVNVTGGTGPFTYSWSPSGGTGVNAINLSAGTYTVSVIDANGCSSTQSITVTEPTALALATASAPASCGSSNGSASVNVSGGTGAYTYSWSPNGGTGATANNISGGSYTVTVTDGNGCISNASVTVANNGGATTSLQSSTNINCNGGNNGSATVSVVGGATPYTYSWSPIGGSNATANGLTAGNYTVTVTDANGCISAANVTITEPTAITASASALSATCGASNGSASVTASGGTGALTYLWSPVGGSGTTANSLGVGSYTVTITDANGCSTTATAAVSNIGGPSITASVGTNVSCNGGTNGTASVNVTGGTGPFTYSWSPAGGTSTSASNLPAGTYTVNVSDANGCASTQSVSITEPTAINLSTSTVATSCGSANGSASVIASGGTGAFTYSWSPAGGATTTATNLIAGNYTVTVTDANGCTSNASAVVANNGGATTTLQSSTNVNCNGGNNGAATVTVSGGATPYTYSWSPSGGSAATATGLTAGNYSVTVTDANGCISSATVTITEPAALTASTSSTSATCGASNGSATVNASGGTGMLTYIWSPNGGTSTTANNLGVGSYTVTVTDASGCTTTATAAVSNLGGPSITASVGTNVSCNGGNNGTASVNVTGGTGPFTYSWSPAGGTSTTANNLPVGTYTVNVSDANGCASTQSVTITEPAAINLSTSTVPTSCGSANGSASVVASGGTGAFTYSWSPAGGAATTANNLIAGNYTVTVTDANGCSTNATAVVANNGGATTTLQSSTNINCNGGNNGAATVNVTGGATPYTYSWSPAGGNAATATGLTAGNYSVTVTDANGCISSATVTITEPSAITANASSTSATCGASNGSATVNASGGTGALTYIWSPAGGTATTASNLGVGSYTVTITDANGCSTTATAAVSNIGGPTITAAVGANVSCNGGNNGTASVNVTSGTAPYTYSWSPAGGTGTNAINLSAGTYTVNVSDANGCASTQSVTITEPAAINLSTSSLPTSCGSANGSATVAATGGTGAFTYSWSPAGGAATTANNLIAGNYTVTVTDANGCASNASVVVANNGGATTTLQSSTNINCNGGNNGAATVTVAGGATPYTYSWSPAGGTAATATGLTAGNYSVTVTDANGCISSASVTITEPAALTAVTSTVPASCGASNGSATVNANGGTGALTYTWSPAGGTATTASNLPAGSYTVTIHDANGCTATANAAVSNIGGPTVTASVGTNVSCNGGNNGTASVNVTSGTGPFTYAWTPAGGTGTNAINLSAGNYSVTVTDANGCISASGVTITQPNAIAVSTSSTPSSCGNANGSASVNASGGTGAFTYAWSPSGGNGITASNLLSGAYTITVTDANGCASNANVSVTNVAGAVSAMQSSSNVSCNGGNNGSATVLATGGTAPYTYSWTPSGGTGATANNLAVGNYTVTVTDGGGCVSNASVIITQPNAITATTSSVPASCGSSNGSASVYANGGTGALTYSWSSGGTAATAPNLTAGNYTVTITDANGCSITAVAAVSNVGGPTAVATVGNNVSCNGGNNGSASVNVSSGTAPFTYAWSPVGGSATTASNLGAGNYTITVTDTNGCITSQPVTITQPTAINLTTASTASNCGSANGSASVNATGGTGTYTYSWSPGNATTSSISNVAAGGFTVTVTDGNGCISNANVTVVNNGGATAAMQSSTNVSCNGGSNGSATVNATGGATPYTYSWSPAGGTAATATNLVTGNYTVTVTDANGCISNAAVFINEPTAITASTTTVPASCGSSNGSATVNASGGTGALSYSWTGGSVTTTASNLSAGNYTVTITDINGCSITAAAAVVNIGGPTATASVVNNVSCNGGGNGSASVNVSAGTGPFTYLWTPAGGTATTAPNLPAGNYSVLVTDANGCLSSQSVTITEPTPVNVTTSALSATCGSSNGSASVFATGGAGGYIYVWSSGGSATTENNLAAGNYSVTVTDVNGCASTATININNTGGGTASLQSLTNVHCNGGNDGTATVAMTGGTSPFTYAWVPSGGTAATGTGLTVGAYTVTVTDANGCITTLPVTINQPSAMGMVMSSTQAACSGAPNGTATAVVNGGTGPYTYLWSPGGGTTSTITGLYSGNYSVLVTDNGGCTETNTVQVTSPSNVSLSMTATPTSCYGGDEGTATVIVTGGTAPFNYSWTPGGQTTATITNLQAGGYAVNVTDASGCISVMAVTVMQPPVVTLSATGTSTLCIGQQATVTATAGGGTAPYTYVWSNGNTNPSQTVTPATSTVYTVEVTDANGCSPANVNVPVNVYPPLNVNATATGEICAGDAANIGSAASGGNGGPYTYSWNNGAITTANATVHPTVYTSYTIEINDGCSPPVQTTVNVNVNPLPVVAFTPHDIQGCTPVNVDFLDESTVPPGSTYMWTLGDGSTSNESNPSHVYSTPGDYNVSLTVVSAAGCQGALTINQLVHVEALPIANFLMSSHETTVLNSTIDFTDKSTNSWTWYWDFGDGKGTSQEVNPAYTYSDQGDYTIMLVTQNQLGCIDTAYSTLRIKNDFAIYVPNSFTPNGDGVNDGFIPFGVGWADFRMVILDRWGLEIYHTTDKTKPWDGTYEKLGSRCQSDVYIYKVLVHEESGTPHELLGHVTLVQ